MCVPVLNVTISTPASHAEEGMCPPRTTHTAIPYQPQNPGLRLYAYCGGLTHGFVLTMGPIHAMCVLPRRFPFAARIQARSSQILNSSHNTH